MYSKSREYGHKWKPQGSWEPQANTSGLKALLSSYPYFSVLKVFLPLCTDVLDQNKGGLENIQRNKMQEGTVQIFGW
jgi:hypothetical protein